jgi:phosphoenolpyruvate-protein kinase (PTS system EI component)
VLVASITTPAWTTMFARATAGVTDIGGPLSHSSNDAREYGIPAVLGTNVATRRIVTGSTITVDGDAGRVILPGDGSTTDEIAAPSGRNRRRIAAWFGAGAAAVGVAAIVVRRRRRSHLE